MCFWKFLRMNAGKERISIHFMSKQKKICSLKNNKSLFFSNSGFQNMFLNSRGMEICGVTFLVFQYLKHWHTYFLNGLATKLSENLQSVCTALWKKLSNNTSEHMIPITNDLFLIYTLKKLKKLRQIINLHISTVTENLNFIRMRCGFKIYFYASLQIKI